MSENVNVAEKDIEGRSVVWQPGWLFQILKAFSEAIFRYNVRCKTAVGVYNSNRLVAMTIKQHIAKPLRFMMYKPFETANLTFGEKLVDCPATEPVQVMVHRPNPSLGEVSQDQLK